jgi:hypothetical protein
LRSEPEQPSIWATRCRAARATYPQTWAGSPPEAVAGLIACADHLPKPAALLGLAPGGVYPAAPVARDAGGLLHHRFTLTRTPTEVGAAGGLSLWHCPASYPGWGLPTTLPCGARTFLDRSPSSDGADRGRPAGSPAPRVYRLPWSCGSAVRGACRRGGRGHRPPRAARRGGSGRRPPHRGGRGHRPPPHAGHGHRPPPHAGHGHRPPPHAGHGHRPPLRADRGHRPVPRADHAERCHHLPRGVGRAEHGPPLPPGGDHGHQLSAWMSRRSPEHCRRWPPAEWRCWYRRERRPPRALQGSSYCCFAWSLQCSRKGTFAPYLMYVMTRVRETIGLWCYDLGRGTSRIRRQPRRKATLRVLTSALTSVTRTRCPRGSALAGAESFASIAGSCRTTTP